MSGQLPDRPNLEQLKKRAKTLLHAAEARDPAALERFTVLPGIFEAPAAERASLTPALHDAQSVIAREHGFASWNALREEVEARTLSFEAAVDEFVRCATGGASGRALRLLTMYPRIASATLETALVLGDVPGGRRAARRPARSGDYACRRAAVGAAALRLSHLRACQRSGAPGRPGGDRAPSLCARRESERRVSLELASGASATALWGALCAVRHLPLAEVLLDAGANPTDGVSTHIAGGGGDLASLDLIHRYGVNVNGIPGGVPPLGDMMQWATDPAGPRWLLEHGADANLSWGPSDEAPLHVAARRWDVPLVEMLVGHGADVLKRRARTDARRIRSRSFTAMMRLPSGCSLTAPRTSSRRSSALSPPARARTAPRPAPCSPRIPTLGAELRHEHHLMLHRPAESGNAAVLETMLACGFDPHAKDHDGVTALHRAAMGGHAEAVRVLLRHGAPVNALDGMFSATPLVWAVEGRRNERRRRRSRRSGAAAHRGGIVRRVGRTGRRARTGANAGGLDRASARGDG